jgi:hypothetical protein
MTQAAGVAGGDLLMAVEPEDVTAGTAGFLVIAALVVGTVFLLRSLNKQLKKVDFEETDDTGDGSAGGGSTNDGSTGDGSTDDGPTDPESPVSDEPEEGPRSPQG